MMNGLKEDFLLERTKPGFAAAYEKSFPLVSVCVATYNRPTLLLKRCIASLLRQTYRNIQIVVVGDHCTDQTEYELSKIRDSRLVFENLPERGPYPPPGRARWCVAGTFAMNRALQLSEGDFIAHLDDDDESMPERLAILMNRARETRAEFLWHKFLTEMPDATWITIGSRELKLGQVTTGSIFYHRFFSKIQWDINAFKVGEPGDWNRIRKIKFLEPRMSFVDEILTTHFREGNQQEYSPQRNELYLET